MKLAKSGSRGVYWRSNVHGGQELRSGNGQRERGEWWIRWACPHGHLHREKIGPKSLAQRESEKRRAERVCPNAKPRPKTYLLSDVINEYLKTAKGRKLSYRDDARYGQLWAQRFGGCCLDDLLPAELDKIRSERLQSVTPATVNREFAFLRHLYNVAIRDDKTDINPVAKLRPLRESSGRIRFLSDDEESRLMQVLSEESQQRVQVVIQAGLRKGDFLGLQWPHLDLKSGWINILRTKNGCARHIPMTSEVRDLLRRLPRRLNSPFVFPNNVGAPDRRWVEKTFQKAIKAATIENFRFHDLRHTFASRLAMAGVDLLSIKELGGWKSLSMVQRYAHLAPEHLTSAVERLVRKTGDRAIRRAEAQSKDGVAP